MCDRPDEGYSRKGLCRSESDFRLFRVWSEGLFPKQRNEKRKLYKWAPPIFCQARVSFQRKTLKEIMKRER